MNHITVALAMTLNALLLASGGPAFSQQTRPEGSGSPDQWMSHQMNQPPPAPRNRHKISSDRMDEIRELYVAAKKELEKKGKKTAK